MNRDAFSLLLSVATRIAILNTKKLLSHRSLPLDLFVGAGPVVWKPFLYIRNSFHWMYLYSGFDEWHNFNYALK